MSWLKRLFGGKGDTPREPARPPQPAPAQRPMHSEGPVLVFQPQCLECSSTMEELEVDTRFPLSGSEVSCPQCQERHHTSYYDGTFTISRVSARIGDTRPMSRTLQPIASRSEPTVRRGLVELLQDGLKLPEAERLAYFANISEKLSSFGPQQVLDYAERLPNPECYALLAGLAKDLGRFNNRQRYYIWYLQGLSLKNMGREAEAKVCACKTLLLDLSPDGMAWQWIRGWFPEYKWSTMSDGEKRRMLEEILRKLG